MDQTWRRTVTIRLWLRVIDKVRGKRLPGERGFLPFEGLKAEERYCETIAHELAHVQQSVRDPEFFQLVDRRKGLKEELCRSIRRLGVKADRQRVRKEIQSIGDELTGLNGQLEAPAMAVEQEVWRELTSTRTLPK